jgi:hypothetical protein
MKTRFLDAALGAALVLAIALTILAYSTVRGPSVEVRNVIVHGVAIDPAREGRI